MSDREPPEPTAFRQLDQLVRGLGEQLAAFRKRAHAAEARVKALEAIAQPGNLFTEQRVKELEGTSPEILKLYREAYDRGGIRGWRELQLKRSIDSFSGWHYDAWEIAARAARLGHADLAFEWLQRAIDARSGMIVWLPTTPEFARLRGDPRYEAALRKTAVQSTQTRTRKVPGER